MQWNRVHTSVLRQARIDFVFEGSKDINGKRSIVHIADDDEAAKASRDYNRGHTYLQNATTLLGDSQWWAGDSMTYADVAMFAALHGLDELRPGFLVSHGGTGLLHILLVSRLHLNMNKAWPDPIRSRRLHGAPRVR